MDTKTQDQKPYSAAVIMNALRSLIKETGTVALDLFKILIPAIIVVKILEEIGAVAVLSRLLEPIMHLFGLPGEMAIVWTTAIVTNIYGGIAVLMMFLDTIELSAAQMTVLSTMILICHALPVELALTQKVGCRFSFLGPLRFIGACAAGNILHLFYSQTGWLSSPAHVIWVAQKVELSIFDWMVNQISNLLYIVAVLFCLLTLVKILNAIGFTRLLARVLKPLLLLMGISSQGASIAVFGLLAGITFGSGLLLAEVKKHSVDPKDIVLVLAFLSLSHGILEDTTLMLLLGGHYTGILVFRLIYSILIIAAVSRLSFKIERFYSREALAE